VSGIGGLASLSPGVSCVDLVHVSELTRTVIDFAERKPTIKTIPPATDNDHIRTLLSYRGLKRYSLLDAFSPALYSPRRRIGRPFMTEFCGYHAGHTLDSREP
jgi:hypothetical protein